MEPRQAEHLPLRTLMASHKSRTRRRLGLRLAPREGSQRAFTRSESLFAPRPTSDVTTILCWSPSEIVSPVPLNIACSKGHNLQVPELDYRHPLSLLDIGTGAGIAKFAYANNVYLPQIHFGRLGIRRIPRSPGAYATDGVDVLFWL